MTLFEIDKAIEECLVVDEATGEVTFDEEKLAQLQMERDRKLENIALYIKDLTAEASAIKAEKLVMAERQRRAEAKVERLKNYLTTALNGEAFSTPKVVVSWRKSSRVVIDDEAFMANGNLQYCDTKITPNKAKIKEALQRGEEIAGVEIIETNNMQIK